jgi:DNA-binding transcriptional ArsR family regulator
LALKFPRLCSFLLGFLGAASCRQGGTRRRMVLVLWTAGFLMAAGARAQEPANVSLEANEQIFAVLAALNAAGYDVGIGVSTGDTTRAEVRQMLAGEDIPVLAQIRDFYNQHRVANDPGTDLGQYISLALLLDAPPDFHLTVQPADLPPDAKSVEGFLPLLRKFYREAGLLKVWSKVQPRYQAQIGRYSPPVRESFQLTDAYLRFPSGTYLGRKYTIDLSLLGPPDQVQARIYGANYYLVVTPSEKLRLAEIRYQYLHFLLDPLALKYAAEIHQKAALLRIAREAPRLGRDYKDDFSLLLTQCLVRAIELRMDKISPAAATQRLKDLTESGLILAPYFYNGLGAYEKQEASLSVYYRDLLEGLDVAKEQKQLAGVKFAPPVQEGNVPPAQSEEERLLDQGDNAISEGRYSDAQAAFSAVLQKLDAHSARALFGLAVVASNTRKPDTAEGYFHKTLETARDLRLVTWSHIYLGRIYDLKGDRKEALEQYRAASLTATRYPEALRAVQSGMAHPFGSPD